MNATYNCYEKLRSSNARYKGCAIPKIPMNLEGKKRDSSISGPCCACSANYVTTMRRGGTINKRVSAQTSPQRFPECIKEEAQRAI